MTRGLQVYIKQINFILMQGGSPQGKISFSFAGGSPSQSPGTPKGQRKVVVSQIQPARVSPAQGEHEVVRRQHSPLMRISPQQLKRVIITNNSQPGLVSPPPPQMVVSHQPVQYSPFKRIESNANKEEIAQNIYEKLELINSKLQKMAQLELQNTLLKSQNKKLKGENEEQKQRNQPEQEHRQVAAQQEPYQKQSRQQALQKLVKEKDLSICNLQQQNQQTKSQLQVFQSRFIRGRQILTKILELEQLKDHKLIGELSKVFDD